MKALFLDRDGTIIVDKHYLRDPDKVELLPGVGPCLRTLTQNGFIIVVVTNQSGIGRGLITEAEVDAQHHRLAGLLATFNAEPRRIVYCPHAPESDCLCRKPKPKMILDAALELGIDTKRSFMIGDKESDVEAGRASGCRTIRIGNAVDTAADYCAPSLAAAANIILRHQRS